VPATDDNPDGAERASRPSEQEPHAPVPCSACRGTGTVISNLGGTLQQVPCPWCDGGGVRLREHDAQAPKIAEHEGQVEREGGPVIGGPAAPAAPAEPDGEPPDQVA
jgi:hypothetical protein